MSETIIPEAGSTFLPLHNAATLILSVDWAKVPEAPVLTLSGKPDLKIYDRLLTVSLVAAVVCA